MQLKLNEITQIREDLKETIEFKANLHFEQHFFGSLYMVEMIHLEATSGQQMELIKLCQFPLKDKFKLLYRASRDGFDSSDFYSKCDGHPNTLTIFEASGTSFIFGTFTHAIWGSTKYKADADAFLFSLTNKDNKHDNSPK